MQCVIFKYPLSRMHTAHFVPDQFNSMLPLTKGCPQVHARQTWSVLLRKIFLNRMMWLLKKCLQYFLVFGCAVSIWSTPWVLCSCWLVGSLIWWMCFLKSCCRTGDSDYSNNEMKCHSRACSPSCIIVVNISVTLPVLWNLCACVGMSQCKWCVFELGFGDDAGRTFMVCHSFKCLVGTCQKVPETLVPLFTSLPSSSHVLSFIWNLWTRAGFFISPMCLTFILLFIHFLPLKTVHEDSMFCQRMFEQRLHERLQSVL